MRKTGRIGRARWASRASAQDVKEIRPAGQASRKVRMNSIGRAGVVGRTSRWGKKERQASQGRQAG